MSVSQLDLHGHMSHDVRYVVANENTLGLTRANHPDCLEVLAGSVIKGGRDPKNGPTFIGARDDIRNATVADFKEFRMSPIGHIQQ